MSEPRLTITVDMDKRCLECGKGGAVDSGICLSCITKAIKGRPMKSARGRAVQERIQQVTRSLR